MSWRCAVSAQSMLPVTTRNPLGSSGTPVASSTAQWPAVSTTLGETTVPLHTNSGLPLGSKYATKAMNGQSLCTAP